jgi:hypothetical protein
MAENILDRDIKKRGKWFSGDKNRNTKISELQVIEIRNIPSTHKFGCNKELAIKYGVSANLIYMIRSGRARIR